ncbi:MAG: zf-HC2 domain-containing protein [Fimbriimonadales bacterium]
MGRTLHCPEWEEKLSLYVDGVLNPFDENAVEAHLSRCESCRATVELWRAVGSSVRRLPRELPPPDLRERILASTTRRASLAKRLTPSWRVLAPALSVGLLLSWLTLPRPQPLSETAVATPRLEETLATPLSLTTDAPHEQSPSAPLVIVVQSSPSYRTASPAPRWVFNTRISAAPPVSEPASSIVVTGDSTPRYTPAATAPTTGGITVIAETPDANAPAMEPIASQPLTPPATATATQDLANWLQQLNQQLCEEDRAQIFGAKQREPNPRRFFVPIVTVDLK